MQSKLTRNVKAWLSISLIIIPLTGCGSSSGENKSNLPFPVADNPSPETVTPPDSAQDNVEIFFMPNSAGHVDFIKLTQAAQKTINLAMFMITNSDDVNALIAAAKRKVTVRVLADGLMLNGIANSFMKSRLISGGVEVKASSSGFSIMHEKSMSVDGTTAMISTINLTNTYKENRGIGVVSKDLSTVQEFDRVFEADWLNADSGTQHTPVLTSEKLVWSPNNSLSKLTTLIQSAKSTIEIYVENFANEDISKALIAAGKRGVQVRVITPLCDENPDPFFNIPMMRTLNANGVSARLMNAPATESTPYIHAKAIIVDSQKTYVGSINFTTNSLTRAREVGIVFTNTHASILIKQKFESDWAKTVSPPQSTEGLCKNN